jgi:DNA-binding beta-propeller fold protein YncE
VLALGSVTAQAGRKLLSKTAVQTTYCQNCPPPGELEALNPIPPTEGQIEGPCGLGISPGGNLYLSDYYHRKVDIYGLAGGYEGQFALGGTNPVLGVNSLDAVCGLAFDSAGNLYANEWQEGVLRLKPTVQTIDTNESTGVAVDGAGNLYVDDRTYVAEYEAPVEPGDEPVEKIGFGEPGSLEDGYGVAVFDGRVYVADAADDTVKVYEPAASLIDPIATIGGPGPSQRFVSLVRAAVAIDPGNGHLLVVDNLQPGFEHPQSAIYEFDSSGAFLDRLPGAPIDGGPSGVAVDPGSGRLFVTDGNGELSNVYAYGPYSASALGPTQPPGEGSASSPASSTVKVASAPAGTDATRGSAASVSEIVQRRGVRVSFDGKLSPRALPRHGAAPVGIAVDAGISASNGDAPPQLRKIAIAINRNGHFTPQGLPLCRLDQIQPSTTAGALAACRDSLVGEGHFSANVKLPQQSPFPSEGKVLAFNGRIDGQPAILAHIYGTQPAPTSTVLPFLIKGSGGTYGTVLETSLPQATGNWGYVTGLKMSLRRRFKYHGKAHSYLSAGCPAPAGFPGAVFPLARTSFAFAGGLTLQSVLNRSCKAKG